MNDRFRFVKSLSFVKSKWSNELNNGKWRNLSGMKLRSGVPVRSGMHVCKSISKDLLLIIAKYPTAQLFQTVTTNE